MSETPVVTAFLRNRGEVLLLRRADTVDSYPARWGRVAGHVEGDIEATARREIREETGLTDDRISLVRRGDSFAVTDPELGRHWRVHPFLFDCERRDVEPNWETERVEWVPPTAILARDTVPELWTSYDRVRPTVGTVAGDEEHGSTYVSMRALEVLRDEAALATRAEQASGSDASPGEQVAAVAHELLDARPSMTAVSNRIHRAMCATSEPSDVETTAHAGIERAARVDSEAAANAAELLGDRVGTLSRSGTVGQSLAAATPDQVLVAESRPGREGVEVAAELATRRGDDGGDGTSVTLTTDAAFAAELAGLDVEMLLVGADAVLSDGRVVNKVGTRGAALAAAHEGIEILVVAASDKIAPGTEYDREERDRRELYDGDAPLAVANPTFDVTPAATVDAVVTERGSLGVSDIRSVAAEHRALREWNWD